MSAASEVLGWVTFLLLVTITTWVGWFLIEVFRAPLVDAEPSRLDTLDGAHCTYADCREPVATSVHAGFDWWPMCTGHGAPFLSADLRDGAK